MRKIPYGKTNFEEIIEHNFLYVDKTKYIEILENQNAEYQFFIRPRKFGKSLFISMLDSYYDINSKDKFESLFGNFYIGKNPTKYRNYYLILRFSFAGIVTSEGKDRLIQSFDSAVLNEADSFIRRYKKILGVDKIPESDRGAERAIQFITRIVKESGKKIYVLIDEYDNFANDIIGQGNKELYFDLLHSEGYVRAFYKALKDGTSLSIARIFITGVSPIMLDDLTSGFNITENYTTEEIVNEIMGFTEEELEWLIEEIEADKIYSMEELKKDIKEHYNGYLFNEQCTKRLYNTDMVLYFLNNLQRNKEYPKNMLDNKVKTDYTKLRELALKFKDEAKMEEIIKNEEIKSVLVDRFSLEVMYNKSENFISLLFYMGMLTIKEADENEITFCIPNYVIKTIYWEYFQANIEKESDIRRDKLKDAMKKMRREGNINEFMLFVSEVLEKLSNRDLQKFDEKYIKAVMLTLFNIDGIYMINSEYEVESGFVDIVLTKDVRWEKWTNYEWVIELKYLKVSEKDRLEEVKSSAKVQLEKYISNKLNGRIKEENLKKAVVIAVGKDIFAEEVIRPPSEARMLII